MVATGLAAAEVGCDAHEPRDHSPVLFDYVEMHHVIPQAWQHFWAPEGAKPNPSTGLWDDRKVALCRTGHGNVHFKLTRLMRGQELSAPHGTRRMRAFHSEVAISNLAMERWEQAGGSLDALRAAGLYGAI